MITITHTHANGTLVTGSVKGDGVYQILHGLHGHWRSSRNLGCLLLLNTRDRAAKTWMINGAAEALRKAGYDVAVEIDDSERRSVAEVEADRAERAEARAERYEERSERVGAKADADYQRAHQMAEAIPFGQPMMPDHYSYGRDRRYRDRIHTTFGRAFEGMDEAKELQRRAESAEANQSHRESIPATLRRIAKLEAEERGWLRTLDGRPDYYTGEDGKLHARLIKPGPARTERINAQLADVREQLAYWREHVKQAEASGVKVWSREDFTKGDYVQFLGTWYEVVRVSAKSVTIPAMINDGPIVHKDGNRCTWTDTVAYHKVKGRKSAAEIAALLAEVERREAEQQSA